MMNLHLKNYVAKQGFKLASPGSVNCSAKQALLFSNSLL